MSEFGRMMDEKDNEIATLKARVAELENALKWEEKGGQAFDNCLAILIDRTAERDKLAAQVEKLRAFARDMEHLAVSFSYFMEHGLYIWYDENHTKPTPLLTGEPSDH